MPAAMTFPLPELSHIVRRIDPDWTLQSEMPLRRRTSALEILTDEQTSERLILLSHSERDRDRNPDIARDEFRLLRILTEAGLPVPQPLYLCETHHPPFLITSYERGSSSVGAEDLLSLCSKLAATLSAIHSIDLKRFDLSFLPRQKELLALHTLPCSSEQNSIRSAMRRVSDCVNFNAPALLHGDFWPGNLLWESDRLTAIIDWEDAMLGDPLGDLGKSRLEILWAFGPEAMESYTAHYLASKADLDASALSFWDLWGALRLSHFANFAPDPSKVPEMKIQYDGFVADAMRGLDAL